MMKHDTVSPAAAHQRVTEGGVMIDVRTESEYADGHPAEAFNIPFCVSGKSKADKNADFLPVVQALFRREVPLMVLASNPAEADRVVHFLRAAGFSDVVQVDPGFSSRGWSEANLPVETSGGGRSYPEQRWAAGLR